MSQILIIDDESASRKSIAAVLGFCGHEVTSCECVLEALKVIQHERYDLIITDMRLPIESNSAIDNEGGLQIIQAAMDINISVPIIVITGYGSIANTVDSMRFGAYDYLTKPINFDELKMKIQRTLRDCFSSEREKMLRPFIHRVADRRLDSATYKFENIIGESEAIKKLKEEIRVAAGSTATVLIQGESGTGKELVAKAIPYNSCRRNKEFITLNCAAFPPNLIEDELFGHRKGAFSSAIADRKGAIEEAEGGTLFLDEIGEMPLEMQPRLLRVLEQKEVKRIGENFTKTVDVRIIAATNKQLEQEVFAGRFRADLFERLNVIVLNLPPLRQIKEDIPLLMKHFLRLFYRDTSGESEVEGVVERIAPSTTAFNRPLPKISDAALDMLMDYDWPRNVRELRNVIERTLLFMDGDVINENNLRMNTIPLKADRNSLSSTIKPNALSIPVGESGRRPLQVYGSETVDQAGCTGVCGFAVKPSAFIGQSLEELKLEAIRQTLIAFKGNKTRTAKALGISTSTLWKALKVTDLPSLTRKVS